MERVTYPSDEVQGVLKARYERVHLDLREDAETAALFKPEAIPVAIVLDGNGVELARRAGFVEPTEYAAWLEGVQR
jgi:hypothetical protein